MRRLPLLVLALLLCALVPVASALAQEDAKNDAKKAEPQVVEPKAGEAVPLAAGQQPAVPATDAPSAGTTGPQAPVASDQVAPGAVTGPTGPAGATTGAGGPQESAAGKGGDDETWLAVAAAVLGGLLLALLITAALWRWRGWDPRWRKRWRHANAEAGWRLSLGWAEFRDFLRLGR